MLVGFMIGFAMGLVWAWGHMSKRLWMIVDNTGEMRAVGRTEGQVWMSFLYFAGTCFSGWQMLGMVERYRAFGFRAVEFGDKYQSR